MPLEGLKVGLLYPHLAAIAIFQHNSVRWGWALRAVEWLKIEATAFDNAMTSQPTITVRVPSDWKIAICNFKQYHAPETWDWIGQRIQEAAERLPKTAPINDEGQPILVRSGKSSITIRIAASWQKPLLNLRACDPALAVQELARIDLQLAQVAPVVQAAPVVQKQVQQVAVNAPVAITTLDSTFQGIAQSQEMFPVALDQAARWLGYRKDNAKRRIIKAGFIEGVDYVTKTGVFLTDEENPPECDKGGRPEEAIYLTVDCFKQFCMLAQTARGREVRLHYLEIERKFKAAQVILTTSPNHDALSQALQGQLDLLHNRISTVEAKVDTVIDGTAKITSWAQEADRKAETRHEEALAAIEGISSHAERGNFDKKTKDFALNALIQGFDGKCIITHQIIVHPDGTSDGLELDFHHIDGNRANRNWDNCCPLSRKGHKLYHANSADAEMDRIIRQVWQGYLIIFWKRTETPLLQGTLNL